MLLTVRVWGRYPTGMGSIRRVVLMREEKLNKRCMNNKNIELVECKALPYLPVLTGLKTTRVVTKHFTNLSLYMRTNMYALLSWLIYQSKNDNTVRYSTHLLVKYRESVLAAGERYGDEVKLHVSVQYIRENFARLVEQGYLLPNYEKFVFTINPMLMYRDEYVRASEYKVMQEKYQLVQFGTGGDVREIGKELSTLVNGRIKDKKK